MTEKTPLITVGSLKKSIGITSEIHDDKINDIVTTTNSFISLAVQPFLDNVPIESNSEWFEAARKCAGHYAMALFYEFTQQQDKVQAQKQFYEQHIMGLINAIKAVRSSRTTTTVVAQNKSRPPISPGSLRGLSVYVDF